METSEENGTLGAGMSGGLVLLFAVACGLSVANLYYAQPILDNIARTFAAGTATAGLVVTLSQIGYAVGLALLVPLGDILNRRRMLPLVLVATAVGLTASALSPTIGVLIAVALLVGAGSTVAQMLVPMAASLATESTRGRVVGRVMSGLLLGILLARTVSGLIAGRDELARRLRGGGGRHGGARPGAGPGAPGRGRAAGDRLRHAPPVDADPLPGRAPPAPPHPVRCPRHGRVQRVLDDDGLRPVRCPLPLRRCRHRPLRPGGRGRCVVRHARRPVGRPRPHPPHHHCVRRPGGGLVRAAVAGRPRPGA